MTNAPEISRSVVPPGGYFYDQTMADGSVSRIIGASLDNVLDLLLKFRLSHGILLAGVEATPEAVFLDYNAQVCGKFPWLCTFWRQTPFTIIEERIANFEPLLTRMQRWVDGIRTSVPAFVDIQTASNRALICSQCPKNVDWLTNCGSCNQNLIQLATAVRGGHRLGIDQMLKGCHSFGTLQELAVWLEDPRGEEKYQAPPSCWRKK